MYLKISSDIVFMSFIKDWYSSGVGNFPKIDAIAANSPDER